MAKARQVPATDHRLLDDYVRTAYIFDLYDGDTVYYHADLGYDTWSALQTGRLLGIDAPELRPLVSREAGQQAKDALWGLIKQYALNREEKQQPLGWKLRLQSFPATNHWLPAHKVMRKCKYGRWLVRLYGVDNQGKLVDINELMLQNGFAKPLAD